MPKGVKSSLPQAASASTRHLKAPGQRWQPQSLVQFFRESPPAGLQLDLERDQDTGRDIEL